MRLWICGWVWERGAGDTVRDRFLSHFVVMAEVEMRTNDILYVGDFSDHRWAFLPSKMGKQNLSVSHGKYAA